MSKSLSLIATLMVFIGLGTTSQAAATEYTPSASTSIVVVASGQGGLR